MVVELPRTMYIWLPDLGAFNICPHRAPHSFPFVARKGHRHRKLNIGWMMAPDDLNFIMMNVIIQSITNHRSMWQVAILLYRLHSTLVSFIFFSVVLSVDLACFTHFWLRCFYSCLVALIKYEWMVGLLDLVNNGKLQLINVSLSECIFLGILARYIYTSMFAYWVNAVVRLHFECLCVSVCTKCSRTCLVCPVFVPIFMHII